MHTPIGLSVACMEKVYTNSNDHFEKKKNKFEYEKHYEQKQWYLNLWKKLTEIVHLDSVFGNSFL